MNRSLVYISIAVLGFVVGISATMLWMLGFSKKPLASQACPLQIKIVSEIRIADDVCNKQYKFACLVKNSSKKPIVAYALAAKGSKGFAYSLGYPLADTLHPDDSQLRPLTFYLDEDSSVEVDFIRFSDGTSWGPDNSKSAGYTNNMGVVSSEYKVTRPEVK